jgi:hypothetical protein
VIEAYLGKQHKNTRGREQAVAGPTETESR